MPEFLFEAWFWAGFLYISGAFWVWEAISASPPVGRGGQPCIGCMVLSTFIWPVWLPVFVVTVVFCSIVTAILRAGKE